MNSRRSTLASLTRFVALAAVAGLTAGTVAESVAPAAGPSLAPPGGIPEAHPSHDPVRAPAVIDVADGRPMIAGRDIGLGPRVHPDWSRPPAHVPAALALAEHPEFYVYDGRPVPLRVDPWHVVVELHDDRDDEIGAARAVGLAVSDSASLGFDRRRMLDFAVAAPTTEAVAARLTSLGDRAEIAFASPTFENPEVEGGWLAVTSDVLVRLQPGRLGMAEAIIADAAPELEIVEHDVAGLEGTYRLRSGSKSGFDVLSVANRLALDDRFAWSEPELIGTIELHGVPNDPGFENSWGLHNTGQQGCCVGIDMSALDTWAIANGDWTVRVLVLDTGIQQDHPDLNLVAGRDFTDGSEGGFGDGSPIGSCDSHGTAVAGCISGRINNELGSAGIAPDARVVSARIGLQDSNPCDSTFASFSSSWVANALNWGYEQGIPITNSSFSVTSSSIMEDAYEDTWFNGVLHFASAGNGGADDIGDPTIGFPARLGTVQSVAALDPDGSRTTFSNYGDGLDFAAPGISIFTTDRTGSDGYSGGSFTYVQGTSFSSPYAAGAAAVVWSALPDYASVAIEFWLQDTADDIGPPGYDTGYGYGIPDARAALNGPGPFNNFCANSWFILTPVFGPLPFDTRQATAFTDEPQEWCEWSNAGVSNSVWFAFFAPCDAVVDISTAGSDYDTVLSLWVGECTYAFPVACDDDSGPQFTSALTNVPVSGDNLYMIKVADYNESDGGGMLDLDFTFRQPNDECADAIEVFAGTERFCTLGGTASALQPTCGDVDSTMVGDTWFRHTAIETGNLTIRACGLESYDTQLVVYEEFLGSTCPSASIFGATIAACSDDAPASCTPVAAELTLPVEEGVRYTIRVAGHEGLAGEGTLTLTYGSCAADFDGDGSVGFADLLLLLNAWGSSDPITDLSNDGLVGFEDLATLLVQWGMCA